MCPHNNPNASAPERLFYIQSLERGAWGNDAVFWRPNAAGYTARLGDAGRYPESEAVIHATVEDVILPCDVVDEMAHRGLDWSKAQQIHRELSDKDGAKEA
jgi:hypothetical protein